MAYTAGDREPEDLKGADSSGKETTHLRYLGSVTYETGDIKNCQQNIGEIRTRNTFQEYTATRRFR